MASAEEILNQLVNHEIALGSLSKDSLDEAFGVERFARLLSYLNEPQKSFRSIQIAGTNGKGSTAFYLSEFLRRYGLSVGSFFSPHLLFVHERLRLDGRPISEKDLSAILSEIALVVRRHELQVTYFEALTAAAFMWFARTRVQVAVLETGLGGRLDSVTHARAEIGIITNIGLDHQRLLGHSKKEILGEKAGILHPDMQLVHGRLGLFLRDELKKYLSKGQCVFALGEDFGYSIKQFYGRQQPRLHMDLGALTCHPFFVSLRPEFPNFLLDNLALAFFAGCLFVKDKRLGAVEGIAQEVTLHDFPGRWHRLATYTDVRGDVPIFFDGGHNPSAIYHLLPELRRLAREYTVLVFLAAFRDKGVQRMLALLNGLVREIHLWRPCDDSPRWFCPEDTARAFARRLRRRRGLEFLEGEGYLELAPPQNVSDNFFSRLNMNARIGRDGEAFQLLSWSSSKGHDAEDLAHALEQIMHRAHGLRPPAVVFVGSLASYDRVRQAASRVACQL